MSALPAVAGGYRSEVEVAADVVAGLLGERLLARSPAALAKIAGLLGVSVRDIRDGGRRWESARWSAPTGSPVIAERVRAARATAIAVHVEMTVGLEVAEVWPDGDAPEAIGADAVAEVMEASGDLVTVLADWQLTDSLEVTVEVDQPWGATTATPWAKTRPGSPPTDRPLQQQLVSAEEEGR